MENVETVENEGYEIDYVVTDGLRFLQSLTEKYGAEKGIEVWHDFGRVLGAEIQGAIFFAMISGTDSTRVHMRANSNTQQVVAIIKCIRQYTGLGLKEAKDLYDMSRVKLVQIECTRKVHSEFTRELRSLGCEAY